MCKRFNCGLTPLYPYVSKEKFFCSFDTSLDKSQLLELTSLRPFVWCILRQILDIRTKYQQFAVVLLMPPEIHLSYQNQLVCGRSFDASLDVHLSYQNLRVCSSLVGASLDIHLSHKNQRVCGYSFDASIDISQP